jgi:hypothetical protein
LWYWGVWTQGLTLPRQVLYHLSHSMSPVFCARYFQNRVSKTICPGLASNHQDPPDLHFWVVRIIGMSHWCLDHNIFLMKKSIK